MLVPFLFVSNYFRLILVLTTHVLVVAMHVLELSCLVLTLFLEEYLLV